LALANAVAQKKEFIIEDRNIIGQLVQQAIREAKSAVALNPTRSTYWETLAAIYRSVIPLAKDADQFAIQSYIQAIALDPTNPNLRVALGGIFYNAKRYDDAIDIYKLAVVAHPKHSNSLYNLAIAYREAGQYDKAVERLTQLQTIVAKDSEDYKLVAKELENVKSKQPKKETTEQTQNLTTPDTKQNVLEPKIELPTDATPPATQAPAANQ
jgi:cytochrome c-type biogenesis protein CcmH/NrfG